MSDPIIQFKGIGKRFPGVQALRDVSFDVARGSCHALCGENGAGKSTLGKILAGIYAPDEGELVVDGQPARFTSPRDAMAAGIGIVHQELAFCENLTVAENLSLGQLPARATFVSRPEMLRRAREYLGATQATIEPTRLVGELPVSQQQLVQIAAAVSHGARILIFDEPTSSLSQVEAEHLFELIQRLQKQGVTAMYVSHRLEEIYRFCDTITVLRDGQHVGTKPMKEVDQGALVQMMIGRALEAYFPGHLKAEPGEELLRVENLASPGKFDDISFTLRAGEVLGFAGLVGAGRTEIAEALFGLDQLATGRVFVRGKPMPLGQPSIGMGHGLGMVPEDRKRHGLVLMMKGRENVSLPTLERLARWSWVKPGAERRVARTYFDRLRVKAPSTETVVAGLSGGNQQKVVLGKWLAAECRVLIVDEPTRGVDVGAKAEIHGLIDDLANKGNGVLLISSELPEVINLSTRILVLRGGRIVGEVARSEATQETLMRLMAGITRTT
ncbi:MAG TPA: sugar ABC transporter ATP-binding protein [Verrucomicrobiae bacterium]|nr:sugar ABC transporter ATP-binding protein [Verrucomicrobiae bacterium]